MAVLKKTVQNLQPVGSKTLDEIIENCLHHLGAGLYCASICDDEEALDKFPKSIIVTSHNESNGEEISFNLDSIVFEKDVDIFDKDGEPIRPRVLPIVWDYQMAELKENNIDRLDEYIRFIKKILYPEHSKMNIKVIKIGTNEYYFYMI